MFPVALQFSCFLASHVVNWSAKVLHDSKVTTLQQQQQKQSNTEDLVVVNEINSNNVSDEHQVCPSFLVSFYAPITLYKTHNFSRLFACIEELLGMSVGQLLTGSCLSAVVVYTGA